MHLFVEEPAQVEDPGELALLRSLTTGPLATGERINSRLQFGEMKKIAALAEDFRIELMPHNSNSLVCTMASLHVCMCTPNATLLEIGSGLSPYWEDLFCGQALQFENGFALPPQQQADGSVSDN